MACFFGRRRPATRPAQALALVLGLGFAGLGLAGLAASSARAAEIDISIDQAKLVKLPERVATLVIGNPLIADVTLQPGGLMVITGKGYGTTNIMALDRAGAVLMERLINVNGPREEVMVVYRGTARETYSCAPECEPRLMLGDNNAYFNGTLSQTMARNGSAQGIANSR
jgi:Flp pilus assembly secretin CpaC